MNEWHKNSKQKYLVKHGNNIYYATLLQKKYFPYLCAMNFRINWDALGIAASVACAIHCAILPLILGSLPILGIEVIENPALEYFMIFLAFVIGLYSLWHGYRRHHHSFTPAIIFSIGIILLVAKQIWHDYQFWILPFAVIFIVTGHIINYRSCRVHNHAHADDCDH